MTENKERVELDKSLDINLLPVFQFLLQRIWLIILVIVIAASGTYIAARLMIRPQYQSSFTAYVNNQAQINRDSLTSSDILASQKIVLTYSKIMTSDSVLEAAAQELGEDYTAEKLAAKVSTEVLDETEIIKVKVLARDPNEAYDISSAIAKVSPGSMSNIVEGSSMRIVDYPKVPTERFSPSYFRLGLIGGLIGMVICMAILIIRYFADDTVKSEEDLEKRFGITVVGVIPDINEADNPSSSYYYYNTYSGEEYKRKDKQKGGHGNGKAK